ncbi:MAG: hypothetical protein HYZ38_20230 [Mycobacterium sp.]|nr:hypothetical protein [Mycobacterium sp.]
MRSRKGVLRLVLAVLAAAGAVVSWLAAQAVVDVAPVTDGEPVTRSVVYDPPLLALALLLAAMAGVLAVVGVAALRQREVSNTHTP